MNLLNHSQLLFAQAATSGAPMDTNAIIKMVGFYAIVLGGFYFVFMRPQQQRAKAQARQLEALKIGDKVTTSSGIMGVVVSVRDNSVVVRSEESKFELIKSAITAVAARDTETAKA
jgi:preprotein translocase subunit YajC